MGIVACATNCVTIDQLIEIISERPGAMPISFTARTKVRLNKKHRETKESNPFGEVWKVAKVGGWVNCSYANAMEKETGEPYIPGESWHDAALDVNEKLTPFAEHKDGSGKLYLRVMRPKTISSSIQSDLLGGVTYKDIAPFMAPPREEPPVKFRTYGLEGLVSVTFGGETYEIASAENILEKETKVLEETIA